MTKAKFSRRLAAAFICATAALPASAQDPQLGRDGA